MTIMQLAVCNGLTWQSSGFSSGLHFQSSWKNKWAIRGTLVVPRKTHCGGNTLLTQVKPFQLDTQIHCLLLNHLDSLRILDHQQATRHFFHNTALSPRCLRHLKIIELLANRVRRLSMSAQGTTHPLICHP